MNIAETLHALVHHSGAFTSETNRNEAHQSIEDELPGYWEAPAVPVAPPAVPDLQARIAELEAEVAKLSAAKE
jgi:hypothetical protein